MGMLRREVDLPTVDRLWSLALSAADGARRCPACERPMKTVLLPTGSGSLQLDVCLRCYFIWFDAKEFEALPPRNRTMDETAQQFPLEARLAMVKMDVEALDTQPDFKLPPSDPPPEGWKSVPAFFGLPVKQESHRFATFPIAAWGLTAIVALFSLLAFMDLPQVAQDFGFIPSELWRYGGLTLLTSFFLHGSAPQLAGNLYFLAAFGDDVDDYLGSGRFLILLLCCTVAGGLLHTLMQSDSGIPLVGASAAISGMLAYYGLQFPRARIGFLLRLPVVFFMRWVHVRAWAYVLGWIVLQAIGALRQTGPFTQVSILAQLGGAGMGLLFWFFWPTHKPATMRSS
jgi:membrane associated rhomboid family serine protease/Zn-finger nucleic acid-binding protein